MRGGGTPPPYMMTTPSVINLGCLSFFPTCPPYDDANQQHTERQQDDDDKVDSTLQLTIHDDGLILRLLCGLKRWDLAEEVVKLGRPEHGTCREFQIQYVSTEQLCILIRRRILAADQHNPCACFGIFGRGHQYKRAFGISISRINLAGIRSR